MIVKSVALLAALGLLVAMAAACGGEDSGTTPNTDGQGQPSRADTGTSVGDNAPPFSVTTTEGQVVSLDTLQDRPFVLYFFATW